MLVQIATQDPRGLLDHYLISKLAWHWRREGVCVEAGHFQFLSEEAGLLICHIDQTCIDPEFIPGHPENVPFYNQSVLDISKKKISNLLVEPSDDWNGPVILKSNFNAFGAPEWHRSRRSFFTKKRRKLARTYWRAMRRLPPDDYPILNNKREVPTWAWTSPNVVVERFTPEREGTHYCLRSWVFFGGRGYGFRLVSSEPVVKVSNIIDHSFLSVPPVEVLQCIRREQMDFGKIDYVEVDGQSIVLDVNKTPSMATTADTERLAYLAQSLWAGKSATNKY
jgi:hypothetical protein